MREYKKRWITIHTAQELWQYPDGTPIRYKYDYNNYDFFGDAGSRDAIRHRYIKRHGKEMQLLDQYDDCSCSRVNFNELTLCEVYAECYEDTIKRVHVVDTRCDAEKAMLEFVLG